MIADPKKQPEITPPYPPERKEVPEIKDPRPGGYRNQDPPVPDRPEIPPFAPQKEDVPPPQQVPTA